MSGSGDVDSKVAGAIIFSTNDERSAIYAAWVPSPYGINSP